MNRLKNIFTLVLMTIMINSMGQIQKIEPEFWWSGMKSTELQLLVYGKDIADLTPEFSDGISIKEIIKVKNPNYLFVTINTENVLAGTYHLLFKKGKQVVQEFDYEFKTRRPDSAERKGFDSSDVFYLLMPDRFANGNPKINSHPDVTEKMNRKDPNGRHGGDIEGIIQHLDYLHDLGVTTLWSTPLLEDNEPTYSYHGYAMSDNYRIDPRYGTNEDYKRLGEELHKRDMKLVKDYITNHWGSQHWIFKDLPDEDWIHHWNDDPTGFKRSNYLITVQFDTNASQDDKETSENGWFDTTMPDMNQNNPLVLNYMAQNAIWWVEYADLDGLRVDTYPYNDKEGIAEWTRRVMAEYPNFNIVGEIWLHNQAQIAYWQKDSKIGALQNYNSHLPTVMDFTLQDALGEAFKETKQEWNTGMTRFYDNFTNDFLYPDIHNIMVFMENHDTERFNEIYTDVRDYQLALALIMTVRGIPQIYYGSEIGMKGVKSKGDGYIRQDFPGGWPGDKQNAFTETERTSQQKEYFDFTKKLLNWRKGKEVIHTGKTVHFVPVDNVYVYFRANEKETIMVIMNNNLTSKTVELSRFDEVLRNYSSGKDIINEKMVELKKDLTIPEKSVLILELE